MREETERGNIKVVEYSNEIVSPKTIGDPFLTRQSSTASLLKMRGFIKAEEEKDPHLRWRSYIMQLSKHWFVICTLYVGIPLNILFPCAWLIAIEFVWHVPPNSYNFQTYKKV